MGVSSSICRVEEQQWAAGIAQDLGLGGMWWVGVRQDSNQGDAGMLSPAAWGWQCTQRRGRSPVVSTLSHSWFPLTLTITVRFRDEAFVGL